MSYIYRIDVVERTEPSGRGIKCLGLAFRISPSRKGALHIVGQGDIIREGLEIDDMRRKREFAVCVVIIDITIFFLVHKRSKSETRM